MFQVSNTTGRYASKHFANQSLGVEIFVCCAGRHLSFSRQQRLNPILLLPLHLENHEVRGNSASHQQKVVALVMG